MEREKKKAKQTTVIIEDVIQTTQQDTDSNIYRLFYNNGDWFEHEDMTIVRILAK